MPDTEPVMAWIALGSNLGDSRRILEDAFNQLQELSSKPILRSSLWRSAPVDCPPGSPDFLNAAAVVFPHANFTPEILLMKLKAIEVAFGRTPKRMLNESRPLDLDLVAFGNEVRSAAQLTLPHPRASERAFVLLPLNEIAPDLILPGLTSSVRELAARLPDRSGVTLA